MFNDSLHNPPGLVRAHLRRLPLLALVVALTFALSGAGCAAASPGHGELAAAVAVGREAWALAADAPGLCGPAAVGSPDAPRGRCAVEHDRGSGGPSFYDEDHELRFRFVGEDGTDLAVRSEREGGVLEVEVSGWVRIAGDLFRVTLGSLAVGARGPGYEEGEVALRAQVAGHGLFLDLDEVRYRRRGEGGESFYRVWDDRWQTPAGDFALEDGLFEGERSPEGRWHMHAEGMVRREGAEVASVELGGPQDQRRAVLALPGRPVDL